MGATPLGEAQIPIRATLDQLDRDLETARGRVQRALSTVGTLALGGLAAATTAVAGLGGALAHLAIDAAPLATVQEAFDGIARSAGSSMDEMIAALEEGSAGMVSQRDLMMTFNQAAQLVSTDFAVRLPDAMEALRKVSASTGRDMGYLLDSLVTGVGRLSPMILDNLAIQVNLTDAYDAYAATLGKSASELTKTEQQTALMNQVLELLARNTENIPDVMGSAQQGMQSFKASIQNLKDRIGLALQPALMTVMETITKLADRVLPPLIEFFEQTIVPIIQKVAEAFGAFFDELTSGGSAVDAFLAFLYELTGGNQELIDTIRGVIEKIQDFIAQVWEVIEPVAQWIGENVKVQDVLIALGIAIAAVIIPALITIVATVGEVLLIFAALVAAIAFVRKVWTEDFLGIRTFMENTWFNVLKPIFEAIGQAARDIAWWWQNSLMPALREVWGFLQTYIFPVFEALTNVYLAALGLAMRVLAGVWQNVLMPAFQAWANFIDRSVSPVIDRLREKVGFLQNWVDWLRSHGIDPLWRSLAGIINITKDVVAWLNNLAWRLQTLNLPSWLRPGSPTPFELGLRGISSALDELTRTRLPALAMGLELSPAMMGTLGSERTSETTTNYNLTINTSAPREDVIADFNMMKVLAGV